MKKFLIVLFLSAFCFIASAQTMMSKSSQDFGAEIGADLSQFPSHGVYNNTNQVGYAFGVWGRQNWGNYGLQTGAYVVNRSLKITDDTFTDATNSASFTSVDIPLLFNYKVNTFVFGTRVYTGPLVAITFMQRQNYPSTEGMFTDNNFVKLDYNTFHAAWVGGLGIDVHHVSFDLRYESGLDKIAYANEKYSHTRMSMFELTIGYNIY